MLYVPLLSAGLGFVGMQKDTSIYELQSAQFANKYFILSGEGSRRLMASPEVVGFDSCSPREGMWT